MSDVFKEKYKYDEKIKLQYQTWLNKIGVLYIMSS